jgi:hypothetical protein
LLAGGKEFFVVPASCGFPEVLEEKRHLDSYHILLLFLPATELGFHGMTEAFAMVVKALVGFEVMDEVVEPLVESFSHCYLVQTVEWMLE